MSEKNSSHRLAEEYKTYKKNGGELLWNAWKHEKTIKLKEQWLKFRDEGGTMGFKQWFELLNQTDND